jgi:acyl CoA:acetate/3-ketoacid CoA transferase beta subunit
MNDPAGEPTRAEVCVVACAEAWRGDGAILASPMGVIPVLGARLAQLTFAPDLLLSDGEAYLLAPTDPGKQAADPGQQDADGPDQAAERLAPSAADRVVEGWLPYRSVFTMVAAGRRHVMMGAAQIDKFGNQNISCIGDWSRPKAQLLGVRGAPGNTINHPTSYWVPRHSRRVFVERVDMVSGIGYDRAAGVGTHRVDGPGAEFHELRVVVTTWLSWTSTARTTPCDCAPSILESPSAMSSPPPVSPWSSPTRCPRLGCRRPRSWP